MSTRCGAVYSSGLGSRGQLGHGVLDSIALTTPMQVLSLEPVHIVQVAAGWWHSIALSESGDLYAWGWNSDGQLGPLHYSIDEKEEEKAEGMATTGTTVATPALVNLPLEWTVVSMACGRRHTAAVCKLLSSPSVEPEMPQNATFLTVQWGWLNKCLEEIHPYNETSNDILAECEAALDPSIAILHLTHHSSKNEMRCGDSCTVMIVERDHNEH